MSEGDRISARLAQELERATPDVWPRIEITLERRRIGRELVVALPRVPSPGSRLAWEARARVERSLLRKAG